MIVYVGDGPGLLPFLLLFGLFFVLVPLLLLRAARHAVVLPPPGAPGGWDDAPTERAGGWDVPSEPALPPVSPADVVSLLDRLGHDVRTLDPGEDPVSRQAMADASERWSTARTLLERADSQAQLRTAWLAAVEGLTAARVVRTRLGLDTGPPVPLPPTGPALQARTRVDVGGRPHLGSPEYEPGRPHWFPGGGYGGRYVPAGWYDAPFWPSALVLGGLAGALGGLAAGAMFADDLDGGWEAGGWGDGGGDWGDGGAGWGDGAAWGDGGGGWGDGGAGWGDGAGWGGGGGWSDGGAGWGDGGGDGGGGNW